MLDKNSFSAISEAFMHKSQLYILLSVLFAMASSAQANPPPPVYDAGALMRQTEQMLKPSPMQRNLQNRLSLPPAMALSESTSLVVTSFAFSGNKLLSEEQLQQVAMPFASKTLVQHDIQRLMDAISEAYRQTGWLVQAYVPRQDVSSGLLRIQVIESIPPSRPAQ